MENKLDVLTKKLYEEGVDKANREAEKIIAKAKEDAAKLLAEAEVKAKEMKAGAEADMENLKKKAESEMALSARQAITALKQSITDLVVGNVAGEMAVDGFKDEAFVQELLMEIVKKWDVSAGNLNLELILSEENKAKFQQFVAAKYKDLLDKGLEIKVGNTKEAFVIQPKDGSYQIAFSEELFASFFGQYMRSFTKALLYK
ncbi:MAG: V-type ATP synthase subunit E [Odoribacter sp.]|nr:V-type ATP synthase subunit E [Odoribacter sp.]